MKSLVDTVKNLHCSAAHKPLQLNSTLKDKEQLKRPLSPKQPSLQINIANMNLSEHRELVADRARQDIVVKYIQGQKEHGGELWKKGLLTLLAPQMRAEAIDQVVYTDVVLD